MKDSGELLERWSEVLKENFPDSECTIPSADSMDIKKLGDEGVINSDTCNTALKTRHLMLKAINEACK